jgi:hypothetical protein
MKNNMGLPRARLVPNLLDASRKDQKQVGVSPGIIGDFNLAKGYAIGTWGRHGVINAI